jgi:hypothetical protein
MTTTLAKRKLTYMERIAIISVNWSGAKAAKIVACLTIESMQHNILIKSMCSASSTNKSQIAIGSITRMRRKKSG